MKSNRRRLSSRTVRTGSRGSACSYRPPMRGPLVVRMSSLGAAETTLETLDVLRIEAGRPAFLIDMDEHTIPLEAGIEDRAISFTKGCYVGQEVIVRVMHRGQGRVAKKLVGLIARNSRIAKSWCLDPRGGSGRRQGHQRGLVACTRARNRVGVRAPGFRIGGNLHAHPFVWRTRCRASVLSSLRQYLSWFRGTRLQIVTSGLVGAAFAVSTAMAIQKLVLSLALGALVLPSLSLALQRGHQVTVLTRNSDRVAGHSRRRGQRYGVRARQQGRPAPAASG